jgi:hypothetical protein
MLRIQLNSVLKRTALITVLVMASNLINAQAFRAAAVTDLKRVFEDGLNLPQVHDTLRMFGIRSEVLSGQCFIQAKKALSGVTVHPGSLKNAATGEVLPSGALEWNFVGTIPLTEDTPNQPVKALERKAPGNFPDYLMTEREISIGEKKFQGLWITIKIPSNTIAGTFKGDLVVHSSQGEAKIPVALTVYPLELPFKRNLKVTEWYNTSDFERFHGIKEEYSSEWFAMLRKYASNMAEHRQNVFEVPIDAIMIRKETDGSLSFDYTRFDQIAEIFWATKGMDFLETGEIARFGNNAWYSTDIRLQDFHVTDLATGKSVTMAGTEVAPALLQAVESHLRAKGWLDKSYFHVKDEPSMHNSLSWNEMAQYIHKYAPDLKRMDAIENTNVLNDIEVAVPKLDAFGTWYDEYAAAQKRGVEIWFYTVGIYQGSLFPNKTIDMPLIDSRLMHWLNYRFDATGYLHWGWNQWTEEPYKAVGMHIGDGWHVYPVKDGVLNSLRWEEMRNGIQDYECFMMLENRITRLRDSLGTRADWIDPKQRGHEIAGRVVMSVEQHSDDPAVLYDAKKQLVGEIMDFDRGPKLYVQTVPIENSTLTEHSSVEVFGWTEPGTKITINGKQLPVSSQGFFFEQFGGDAIDRTKIAISQGMIKVTASGSKGTKELTRKFNFR